MGAVWRGDWREPRSLSAVDDLHSIARASACVSKAMHLRRGNFTSQHFPASRQGYSNTTLINYISSRSAYSAFSHVTRDIILLHSVHDLHSFTSSTHHQPTPPTMASTALIIGASQGLGASLVRHYAQKLSPSNVFATIRESAPKSDDLFPKGVNVIPNIDVSKKDCGDKVVDGLQGRAVDHVWIVAGLLKGEVSQILYPLVRVGHLDYYARCPTLLLAKRTHTVSSADK
jgi:hypothetical protein